VNIIDMCMLIILGVFYSLFIGRTIMLRTRGIKPFVLGTGKKGLAATVEKLFFAGLLVWSFEIVRHSVHWNTDTLPVVDRYFFNVPAVQITGLVIAGLGLIIFLSALISFGSSWRVGIDKENPGNLITTGIFAFSRNPIFLFIDLFFIGVFLVYSNLFFLLALVIVIAGIHYQILQEEKFLGTQYGDAYVDYRNRVRRYI
jgi:protein-S-isoprenylcysteine O-methyltransferase Ste14